MPDTIFGNTLGPVYPLGAFTPIPGTPVALSTNVPVTTALGTPTGGIAGLTTAGSPAPLSCNRLKVSNTDTTHWAYLVFMGQAANTGGGTSIILAIPPGTTQEINCQDVSKSFALNRWGVDADAGWAGKIIVTAFMV